MNQEYVLLGWKLWRLLGKRLVLWRNHKMGSAWTRIAAFVSHSVCYTSPEAYIACYKNAVQMPIGIDTNFFKPPTQAPQNDSILFLGRLDSVKKPEVFIAALQELADDGVPFHADMYGDPTDPGAAHVAALKKQAAPLVASGVLALHPGIPNEQTPAVYGAHAIYVNLTPSGSFDKTIGEAMACGNVVVAANDVLRGAVSDRLIVVSTSIESVTAGLAHALSLNNDEREPVREFARDYVVKNHSLRSLGEKLRTLLESNA